MKFDYHTCLWDIVDSGNGITRTLSVIDEKFRNIVNDWNESAKEKGIRKTVYCNCGYDFFSDRDDPVNSVNNKSLIWCERCGRVGEKDTKCDDNKCRQYFLHELRLYRLRRIMLDVIDANQSLDWVITTKHPENIIDVMPNYIALYDDDPPGVWVSDEKRCRPRPNLWVAAIAGDQKEAQENVTELFRYKKLFGKLGACVTSQQPINFAFDDRMCDGSETGGPPGCGQHVKHDVLSGWETCGCCDDGCVPVGPTLDFMIVTKDDQSIIEDCEFANIPVWSFL